VEFTTVLSDSTMESFIGDLLPSGVNADLTMSIVLPTWASTIGGGNTIDLSYRASGNHDGAISLTGSESFSWDHAICRDTANAGCFDNTPDMVCASTSRSCGYIDVDWDLEEASFASLPLTKGGTVEFALKVEITIHRIGVPDSMFDSFNTDSTSLELDVLPADLFRTLLDIGSRGDPLEHEFDLCGPFPTSFRLDGRPFCDQIIPFTNTGLPAYTNSLERDIESLISYVSTEMMEDESNGIGNVDMSAFSVDIELPYDMLIDNDDAVGDERGIVLTVEIPRVKITTGIDNSWFELIKLVQSGGGFEIGIVATDPAGALLAPFLNPMVAAMDGLTGALSASMVSADGLRTPEAISIDFPSSMLSNVGPEEMGLDLFGFVTFTLPLGIELEDLSSSMGRVTSEMDNSSRQVITYEIAPGMTDDKLEFNVLLTPMWVLSQIQYYLIGLILFALWRTRRRMTKKKRKRRAASLEALEESVASPMGYIPPQPTVEVLQVSDNGIVVKRRLVAG